MIENELDRFKEKSVWVPNEIDPGVKLYLSSLQERVLSIKERGRNFNNLSTAESEALKNLKGYRDIIIIEADKGSAVVIWSREEYCKEAYDQLGDRKVYVIVEKNTISKVSSLVGRELDILVKEGFISQKNKKYILNPTPRPKLGRFYLLPKIHKGLEKVYQLFLIVRKLRKEFLRFGIFISNHL